MFRSRICEEKLSTRKEQTRHRCDIAEGLADCVVPTMCLPVLVLEPQLIVGISNMREARSEARKTDREAGHD